MRQATNEDVAPLQCLMCGGLRHRPIFNESGIDVLRCRECHHVFSSFEANPHYDGFWGEEVAEGDHFYWKTARARMYQDFFKRFLVGHSGRLLDMGCGLGFFLKAMAPYANWEAYGCEISPAAVRYARETLGLTNVICGRLEDADLPQSSFDIITMWDVIDHIPRPDPLLRRCHALLREGGICFIRTPNVFIQLPRARLKKLLRGMQPGVAYLQARDHAHHYSVSSIRRLLERNGFSRVQFVHLHPVQSLSGSKSGFLPAVKTVCFEAVRALATVSRGHLNFDNLFVRAHKESQRRPLRGSTAIGCKGRHSLTTLPEATVTDGGPQSRNAREQLLPPLTTRTSIGQASRWRRHFVYRTQCLKTTWKCRLAILIFVILIASLTRGFWIPALGRSLTCTEEVGPSDVILVENFDTDYLLFERAAALEKAGLSARILVPTEASRHDPEVANTVSRGIVELMARVARVQNLKIIPTRYIEPISLNVAYQIRDSLIKEHLRSVIVVTPALRSRRSSLVYRAVLRPAGIQVYCMPVLDEHTPENWTANLHGIEQVTKQFIKLQFYRFYVLPLSRGQSSRAGPDYRSPAPSAAWLDPS